MFTVKRYTAEVGTFSPEKGRPNFHDAYLRVPLVGNTYIGRATNTEEQGLCDGGIVGNIEQPNIVGIVQFIERPSYNGKKLIIPNDIHGFSRWISREHGELRLKEGDIDFYYRHLSKSGMRTALWIPSDGLVEEVQEHGQMMKLHFPSKGEPQLDRYLLLGGMSEGRTLEERFPYYSYYVLVRRNMPDNSR